MFKLNLYPSTSNLSYLSKLHTVTLEQSLEPEFREAWLPDQDQEAWGSHVCFASNFRHKICASHLTFFNLDCITYKMVYFKVEELGFRP